MELGGCRLFTDLWVAGFVGCALDGATGTLVRDVPDKHRFHWTSNGRLFGGDGFQGLAQNIGVFEAERCDDGEVGGYGARGVQSTAQPGFQHEHVGTLVRSHDQRHQQGHLEEGQGEPGACGHGVNVSEGCVEDSGRHRSPVKTNPLFRERDAGR